MSKKTVFLAIGILAIAASVVMYMAGKNSSRLTELKQYWWIPLPLALIALIAAGSSKPKS